MPNRSKAEAFIFQFLKDIEPTGYNVEQYKTVFKEMSDKDFDTYISKWSVYQRYSYGFSDWKWILGSQVS